MHSRFAIARRIVVTRNFLIHGYDSSREDLVWAIVVDHIRRLRAEVEQLVNDY